MKNSSCYTLKAELAIIAGNPGRVLNRPFFSIVIPTYNRAGYVIKTLRSLLDQDFRDFEVIVVDDGGNDETGALVKALDDSRVFYQWKANEERAAARNFGAQCATGEYINFFDSDDLAYPNHLKVAMQLIHELKNPEVFHLAYDIKMPDGRVLGLPKKLPGLINDTLPHGNALSCNGVFIRKDIALQYPFNTDRDLSATEDWELWLRLACRFPFYHSNKTTTSVINHDSRSVIRINDLKLIKRKQLFIKYVSEDPRFVSRYGGLLTKMEADAFTYIALHLAIARYPAGYALKYLMKSLLKRPFTITERRFWGTIKTLILR